MGGPGGPYIIMGGGPRIPFCRPEKVPPFFPRGPGPGIIIIGGGGPRVLAVVAVEMVFLSTGESSLLRPEKAH